METPQRTDLDDLAIHYAAGTVIEMHRRSLERQAARDRRQRDKVVAITVHLPLVSSVRRDCRP